MARNKICYILTKIIGNYCFIVTLSSASHKTLSVSAACGSRFSRSCPEKRTGYLGTTDIFLLSNRNGIVLMLTSSIQIASVDCNSAILSNAEIRADFPAPTHPTTPTWKSNIYQSAFKIIYFSYAFTVLF